MARLPVSQVGGAQPLAIGDERQAQDGGRGQVGRYAFPEKGVGGSYRPTSLQHCLG